MQTSRAQFRTMLPMSKLAHHTISVLHRSVVCDLGQSKLLLVSQPLISYNCGMAQSFIVTSPMLILRELITCHSLFRAHIGAGWCVGVGVQSMNPAWIGLVTGSQRSTEALSVISIPSHTSFLLMQSSMMMFSVI